MCFNPERASQAIPTSNIENGNVITQSFNPERASQAIPTQELEENAHVF